MMKRTNNGGLGNLFKFFFLLCRQKRLLIDEATHHLPLVTHFVRELAKDYPNHHARVLRSEADSPVV
jgi:hypothetical protein